MDRGISYKTQDTRHKTQELRNESLKSQVSSLKSRVLSLPLILIVSIIALIASAQPAECQLDGPLDPVKPSIPDHIVIVSGNGQSGRMGTPLPEPLVAKVLDPRNRYVSGVEVTFTVISGGGTLTRNVIIDPEGKTSIAVNTNSEGKASITLILGETSGVNIVEARVEGINPVTFTATAINSPPKLEPIGDKQVDEAGVLSFTVSATDPDPGDTVTLSASALPANASFNPSTGAFTFAPDYTQSGIYSVTFSASDGSLTDTETVTITVRNVNRLPVLNPIGDRAVDEDSELVIVVSATDPDGDTLSFSASEMPPGSILEQQQNASQSTFRWTPGSDTVTSGDALDFQVTFAVSDTWGGSDSEQMTITVRDTEPPPAPDIRVLPPSIDFGVLGVGESADAVLQIHNDGNALLEISSITSTDPQFVVLAYSEPDGQFIDATYSEANSQLVTVAYPGVAPGSSLLIKARFTPSSEGTKLGELIIASNDPDEPAVSVAVQGKATQTPDIRVSPSSLDFGEVEMGQSSDKNLHIHNDGDSVLQIHDMIPTDSQFTVLGSQDTRNVDPFSEITVVVQFTPASPGPKTAELSIVSDDPDEPIVAVSLQGSGIKIPVPDIRVSPSSIDFGQVEVGESRDKEFWIHNDGDAILQISGVTSNNSQFVILDDPDVEPGGSVVIPVRFAPSSSGAKTGVITITSNDPDEPSKSVSVQGKGIATPEPDIRVSTSSIDFGQVVVGESRDKKFRIYNDGNAKLIISSIKSNNSHFVVLDDPDVEPGDSIAIPVRFAPSSSGPKTGVITIASNDPDEPSKSVSVQGKGIIISVPDIRVSPSSIDFGQVAVGGSRDKEFQIHNDGNAKLIISSITSNSNQFAILDDPDVEPGGVVTIPVRFAPSSSGVKTGVITIASNDPDESSKSVSVQGKGIITPVPDIRVSTSSINFGEVEVGESLDKGFRIYNDGSATLQISSITSSNSQFVILDDPDVEPGGVITIPVRFTPSSSGVKTGVITIASNDPDEPSKSVSVQGKGIAVSGPDIRVPVSSIDFGEVEVGRSLDKKFRIYNDGGATLVISSITSNNSHFVILDDPNVAPGGMVEITVRFTPLSSGTEIGVVTIASNDPDEPTVLIVVEGEGVAVGTPDIYVSHNVIDFGEVELGGSSERSFYIHNLGGGVLRIFSLTSSSNQFQIWDDSYVESDDSIEIPVRFTPSSLGSKSGVITITSNDPDEPSVQVQLYGEGIYPGGPAAGNWRLAPQHNLLTALHDVHFADEDDGWVVGDNGTVAHSRDGGHTWALQSSGTSRSLKGVHFSDSNSGWAVGRYGTLLRTTNGGRSWSSQSSGVTHDLNAVTFVGQNRGWAVGEAGTVLTTNNGYAWVYQDSGTHLELNDVCFINSYRGWAVGNYGTILRSNDGGRTWIAQHSGTSAALHGVDFIDYYEGWVVGSNGTILHTQDSGQTWVSQSSSLAYGALIDVDFLTSSEGWTVGYSGRIFYTDNGGSTWARVDSVVDRTLRSVQFHDADNGWAVGDYGTILEYYTEQPPVITYVTVSGSPAGLGDVITVTAVGVAGNEASFSISGVVPNVAMKGSSSGTYTGSYTVVEGVNVTNATVTVRLANEYGDVAIDASRSVTIDTIARINWARALPKITKAGDIVTVGMGGESDGTASFSIETIATDVAMTEDPNKPGSYTGQYPVPQGADAENVKVTVKLTDQLGNVSIRDAGQITIDTTALITSVSVTGSPAKFGEPIVVVLTGDAGGSAKFSISGLVSDVDNEDDRSTTMIENQPGVYTGSYAAPKGTHVKNGTVTVQLTDALGNIAVKDAGKVTIDTESRIESVSVSGSPARAGEAITIVMIGESDGAARFSIAGVTDSVPMDEIVPSGTYKGAYIVAEDDASVTNAVLTVALTDAVGNLGMDASRQVTIDTAMPEITSVSVSGSPAKAGGTINITMMGEQDGTGQFSITGVTDSYPMNEVADQPGTYRGAYTVADDDSNVTDAVLTVTLMDAVGNMGTDTGQSVTIDTTIPEITSVTVSGSPAKAGETVTITIVGESNGSAQFSIAGITDNVPMEEVADQSGTYKGTYTVAGDDTSVIDAVLTVSLEDIAGNVGSDATQKVTILLSWDANNDGVIDVSDLVVIGTYFGEEAAEGNDADVNGDGYVNILDLILISKHFGESAVSASPGKETAKVESWQLPALRKLYASIQDVQSSDANLTSAKKLLAELIGLTALEITESRLMQNYPNPCNPETWIPYNLAEPGNVTISIYSSAGRLVRTLDLGYKEIGSYSDGDKAAYWDGTNESGEEMSSGIYFYVLKSGDFNAVRKMILSK